MNAFIIIWKNTIKTLVLTYNPENNEKRKEIIKNLAIDQLDYLIQDRPDKTKELREQNLTKMQIEYLDYLEKVIETGEL